jgi:hypothetical protein
MDYGRIIQDAFRLSWRNRFLWIFALFGGGGPLFSGGGGSSFTAPLSGDQEFDTLPPELAEALADLGAFLAAHAGTIFTTAVVFALIGVVFVVLSVICRGALIASSARIAQGEAASLSWGWHAGLGLVWRFVRLWLIGLLIGIAVAFAVGFAVAALYVIGALGEPMRVLAVILGIFLGVVGFGAAIALGVALTIVFGFAERAIAIDQLGARAALTRAVGLMRSRVGDSLVLWLIWLVLAIAAGIGLMIFGFLVAIPFVGVVIFAFFSSGVTAGSVGIAVIALLFWIGLIWLISAPVSTLISVYWTLGYLAITDRYPGGGPPTALVETA